MTDVQANAENKEMRDYRDLVLRIERARLRVAVEGMRPGGTAPPHITLQYVLGVNWTVTRVLALLTPDTPEATS